MKLLVEDPRTTDRKIAFEKLVRYNSPKLVNRPTQRKETTASLLAGLLALLAIGSVLASIKFAIVLPEIRLDSASETSVSLQNIEREAEPKTEQKKAKKLIASVVHPPARPDISPVFIKISSAPTSIPVPEVEEPVFDDFFTQEEVFETFEEPKPAKLKPKASTKKSTSKAKPTLRSKSAKASLVSGSTLTYPRKAKREGIEGRVVVTITITPSGRVSSAHIASSSGNSSLDAAALKAAKKYRFTPAKNSAGQAIGSQVSLPFIFELN